MAIIPTQVGWSANLMPFSHTVYRDTDAERDAANRFYEFSPQYGGKRFDAQIAAQRLPAELAHARFNTVFPYLQGQMSQLQGQMNSLGGASPPGPHITAAPIWNPQMLQQQINAGAARTNQQVQGQQLKQQQELSARGFGAGSPLLLALQNQAANQGLASNVANEREMRLNMAQANAGQLLKGQMAQEQQFAARQQEDIERRKPYWNSYNAMIAALAGIV